MHAGTSEFFEDINDALREAVRALGGVKQVGAWLWPEIAPDTAGNRLRDCLNPERREKLSPEQVLFILRRAREVGYHAAMEYLAASCGYAKPAPLAPEDKLADLQRQFIASVESLERIQRQIQSMQGGHAVPPQAMRRVA